MIRSLRLAQFKQFERLELTFTKPLVLVVGDNEAGKSTIRDAILFLLTGFPAGITMKKDVGRVVVRDGAKSATVSGEICGLKIERKVTKSGSGGALQFIDQHGELVSGREVQTKLYERLGLDEERVRAAIDSWAFLEMRTDVRKRLLHAVVGKVATIESVTKKLAERGLNEEHGADILAHSAVTISFKAALDEAIESRRAAKRKIADCVVVLPANVTIEQGRGTDFSAFTLNQVKAQLAHVETEYEAALHSGGEERGNALAELRRLEALEKELLLLTRAGSPDAQEAADARAEASRGLAELDAEVVALEAAIDPNLARDLLPAEIPHPGHCPVIYGKPVCPMSENALTAWKLELEGRREAMDDAISENERQKGLAADARIRRDLARSALSGYESALKQAMDGADAFLAAEARLETTRDALGRLRTRLEVLPAPGEAPDVSDLRARRTRGAAVVAAKEAFDLAQQQQTEVDVRRVAAEADLDLAQRFVDALSPEAIELELVREAVGPLSDRLAVTGGLIDKVSITPALELEVECGEWYRSYEQLSRSQKLRLGTIAQDMIAFRSGLPVLILDEVDTYDTERQNALMALLQQLIGQPYESIVVLATLQSPAPPPSSDTMQVIHLRNGGAQTV